MSAPQQIAAKTARSRDKHRLSAPLTARQQAVSSEFILDGSINGPEWYASRVSIPEEVNAGGIIDVEVDITNERVYITPLNPYACADGVFSGVESTVTVDPGWTTESESTTFCTEVAGITPSVDTFAADFRAPSTPGTYDIAVTVESANGDVGGTVTYEVLVVGEGAGDRPDDGDDRGGQDDGGDNDGDTPTNGGAFIGAEAAIALSAFALLALVAFNVSR